jgi:hypothetical protein
LVLRINNLVPNDYFMTMSANKSIENCLPSDSFFLDSFSMSLHHRSYKNTITVNWETPYGALGQD